MDVIPSLNSDWYSNKARFSNIPYAAIICKSISLDKRIEEFGPPELIKIDVNTYIHTYIRMYIHTYIRTYVYTYIHTYVCIGLIRT
jgi:hypothetical protein